MRWGNKTSILAAPVFPQYKDFGIQVAETKNTSSMLKVYVFDWKEMTQVCDSARNATLINQLRKQYEGE